jgi:hypothetical protein
MFGEFSLHRLWIADEHDLTLVFRRKLDRTGDNVSRRVVSAHRVDGNADGFGLRIQS